MLLAPPKYFCTFQFEIKKNSNLVGLLDERNDPALFKQQNRELEFADPALTKEGWLWLSDMKNMKWSFLGSLYSKSLG